MHAEGASLITGSSGFIGRRLKAKLAEDGESPLVLLRPSSKATGDLSELRAAYEDLDRLTELMKTHKPARIFHVAGVTKGVSYADFQRGNVMPTEHLIKACQAAGHTPERFVHISSLAAYGPAQPGRPLDADAEAHPAEFYGRSKLEAERVVEKSGLPYTIIRPSGVYGPGDVDYFEHFKMAAKGYTVFFGNRHRQWSAIYVDDLLEAILSASQHAGTRNKGYFICDGQVTTWERFQRMVAAEAKRKVRELDLPEFLVNAAAIGGEWLTAIDKKARLFNRQKAIMSAQEAWTCQPDAATEDFGFIAKTSQEQGVRLTFDWYRREGWIR